MELNNCVYVTGDSNHIIGREAVGNASSVWIFTKSYTPKSVEKTIYLNVFLGALIYYRNTTQKQLYSNYLRTKKFTLPYWDCQFVRTFVNI